MINFQEAQPMRLVRFDLGNENIVYINPEQVVSVIDSGTLYDQPMAAIETADGKTRRVVGTSEGVARQLDTTRAAI